MIPFFGLSFSINFFIFYVVPCDCNEIKVECHDDFIYKHNAPIGGEYEKAPTKLNGYSYYVSFSGKYAVWYNGQEWWIGNTQDKGSSKGFAVLQEILTYPVNHKGWKFNVLMPEEATVEIKCSSE